MSVHDGLCRILINRVLAAVLLPLGLAAADGLDRVVRQASSRRVEVEYALPLPERLTVDSPAGQSFTRVKAPGGGRTAEVGRPELPTLVDDLEIAAAGEVTAELEVEAWETVKFPHWVYPAQPPVPKRPGAREAQPFVWDEDWYRQPRVRAASKGLQACTVQAYTVRGRRWVRVTAAPYGYDPVQGELSCPTRLRLRVRVADPVLPKAAGPRPGPVEVLRVGVVSSAALDDLASRGLDIKTVEGASALVYATADEAAALRRDGYKVTTLGVQDPGAPSAKAVADGVHDWAQVQSRLAGFAADYPSLCRLETVGMSPQGRPLLALCVTDNPGVEEAEPEVRLVGAIHGDEVAGTELCLRLIEHLLSGYAVDDRLRALVDATEIWVMPVMNPDGHAAGSRYSAAGIDLNRSFPDGATQAIGTLFSGVPMDTAGRPAETVAMMQWSAARNFVLSATFHTGALVANYPYDNDGRGSVASPTPDEDVFRWLAETYSAKNLPMASSPIFPKGITNGAAWYAIEGGLQDWLYRYLGCFDLTLEVSREDRPSGAALEALWADNREAILAYLEAAHSGLEGRVIAADSGEPLHASIAVEGRASLVTTDPDHGDYYRLLRPGAYRVTISAPGYEPAVVETTVQAKGSATRLDVALSKGAGAGLSVIVVHHPDHDSAFAAYRDQKTAEGCTVTQVRLDGTPTADAVRAQVRAAYAATGADTVVILGDISHVPTFTNVAYGTYVHSDLPYALLDPGETFDDYLGKDVMLGRISLDTAAELHDYIAKLAAFQRGPRHRQLTWVSGGSTTWENNLAEGTHDAVIASSIDPDRYQHRRFYRNNGSAAELTAQIDAGTDLVVYSGHGFETGWLRYDYGTARLAGLSNTLDAPIVLGHCCLTGAFQLDDCFAEAWLETTARAVAYVGGSENTYWEADDRLERAEFAWLAENPTGTLGAALDGALRQTAADHPALAEYYFSVYHIFGDPTVRPFGQTVTIHHDPVAGSSDRAGPYAIEATVSSSSALTAVTLRWRLAGQAVFQAVPMTSVAGSLWRGLIPGQAYGSRIEYYLEAANSDGATAMHPPAAPAAWHGFSVDIQVDHVAQGNTADTANPYALRVVADADAGVDASLFWRAAGGAFVEVPMAVDGAGGFTAAIPAQPAGTTVQYYFRISTTGGYAVVHPSTAPALPHAFLVETAPPIFAGLAAAEASDGRVVLTWDAASDVSTPLLYAIYRAETGGAQVFGTPLATTPSLGFSDDTVTNGTIYYYVVRARDAAGNEDANRVEFAARPQEPEPVYVWNLDTDPGWTRDPGWAYGVPLGLGGENGSPDPRAGFSGPAVYGYNLAGDYENSLPARNLTTLAIDCSAVAQTELRFRRWLNVEEPAYDRARVQVSCDGITWVTIWENSYEITDRAWTEQRFDIARFADGCATVRIRWVMGPTDSSWAYSGWNLDDIAIWGLQADVLRHELTLTTTPAGSGAIQADLAPGPEGYVQGTVVTLTAVPAPGYAFAGWSGDATGGALTCQVVMHSARAVTATFVETDDVPPLFAGLAAARPGLGRVTLEWPAAVDAIPIISYQIYRSRTPGVYDYETPLATTAALQYVDDSVLPGVTYHYVVRATDSAGNQDANTRELTAGALGRRRSSVGRGVAARPRPPTPANAAPSGKESPAVAAAAVVVAAAPVALSPVGPAPAPSRRALTSTAPRRPRPAAGVPGRPAPIARPAGAAGWRCRFGLDGQPYSEIAVGMAPQSPAITPAPAGAGIWIVTPEGPAAAAIAATAPSAEWIIAVSAANRERLLAWTPLDDLPPDTGIALVETDAEGRPQPGGLAADLRRDEVLAIPAGADRRFLLRTGPAREMTLNLQPGWNAIALPLSPWLPAPTAVFADVAVSPQVWRWDAASGAYLPAAVIEPLTGYWVYADAACLLTLRGTPLSRPVLSLFPGWNLVGVERPRQGLGGLVWRPAESLAVGPPEAAAAPAAVLPPGVAFWVRSDERLEVFLESSE
ncbi:MAG: hypothetical protein GX595_06330 [Lentisphaerae bacterium]|nr:hypothetical protein [Lentisphaerota bacterium]